MAYGANPVIPADTYYNSIAFILFLILILLILGIPLY